MGTSLFTSSQNIFQLTYMSMQLGGSLKEVVLGLKTTGRPTKAMGEVRRSLVNAFANSPALSEIECKER